MDLKKIRKENKELIKLAEIPFEKRTEEQTKRIYELIDFQKDNKPEDKIQELEEIRLRITQIYMELGNPDYVEADSILNKDIAKLKESYEHLKVVKR